jgi:hypothetical protein
LVPAARRRVSDSLVPSAAASSPRDRPRSCDAPTYTSSAHAAQSKSGQIEAGANPLGMRAEAKKLKKQLGAHNFDFGNDPNRYTTEQARVAIFRFVFARRVRARGARFVSRARPCPAGDGRAVRSPCVRAAGVNARVCVVCSLSREQATGYLWDAETAKGAQGVMAKAVKDDLRQSHFALGHDEPLYVVVVRCRRAPRALGRLGVLSRLPVRHATAVARAAPPAGAAATRVAA